MLQFIKIISMNGKSYLTFLFNILDTHYFIPISPMPFACCSNPMIFLFYCKSFPNRHIAAKFCTCQDSYAPNFVAINSNRVGKPVSWAGRRHLVQTQWCYLPCTSMIMVLMILLQMIKMSTQFRIFCDMANNNSAVAHVHYVVETGTFILLQMSRNICQNT